MTRSAIDLKIVSDRLEIVRSAVVELQTLPHSALELFTSDRRNVWSSDARASAGVTGQSKLARLPRFSANRVFTRSMTPRVTASGTKRAGAGSAPFLSSETRRGSRRRSSTGRGRLAGVHQHAELLPQRPVESSSRSCFRPRACSANSSRVAKKCRSGRISRGMPADFARPRRASCTRHSPGSTTTSCSGGRPSTAARASDARSAPARPPAPRRWPGPEWRVPGLHPLAAERVFEVPHRGEEDRDRGLVRPDVGRLLGDLRHPHPIPAAVEPVESRAAAVELVAEHEHESASHREI